MRDNDRQGLVAEMDRLVNEVAPVDPDIAAHRLHALIDRYGCNDVRAALIAVAPDELAELTRHWRHRG